MPVVGKYTVGAVEPQVWVKGATSTEVLLGVKLARIKVGVLGWTHSGELQMRVGDEDQSGCDRVDAQWRSPEEGWR